MNKEMTTSGRTIVTTPSDREILSERIFEAPRQLVFDTMTDPNLISEWWGPRGITTVVDRMEVRPGGTWRFVQKWGNDESGFHGTYREVTPPERIVNTFEWEGMPGHVLVETITFEELEADRTKVRIVSLFHTTEERDGMLASGMEGGLGESHDRLAELLARLS